MKIFTSNLLKFTALTVITTALFKLALSGLLKNGLILPTIIIAIIFGLMMFFFGWYFGKKDYEYLPIFDLGLRYNVVTFIIFNGISELWFVFKFNAPYENITSQRICEAIWLLIIIVHLIVYLIYKKKHSYKGLDKAELFE
ncbi:hypothetical protein LJC69_04335 [Bacteroidales bacterium OttesenSCG-928-K22]|nr:hypothetical protein [Bacteroidales bacterium OttesenSCG-928-K22]